MASCRGRGFRLIKLVESRIHPSFLKDLCQGTSHCSVVCTNHTCSCCGVSICQTLMQCGYALHKHRLRLVALAVKAPTHIAPPIPLLLFKQPDWHPYIPEKLNRKKRTFERTTLQQPSTPPPYLLLLLLLCSKSCSHHLAPIHNTAMCPICSCWCRTGCGACPSKRLASTVSVAVHLPKRWCCTDAETLLRLGCLEGGSSESVLGPGCLLRSAEAAGVACLCRAVGCCARGGKWF